MGKVGFEYCQRIVMYGRVTGPQLISADYEFMRDTLGIIGESECAKLKEEIGKVLTSCLEDCALFAWG